MINVNIALSPSWFLGYDSLIELFGMFTALLICFYSYRLFRMVKEKKYLYLSLSFFFIGAALAARAGSYLLMYFSWGHIRTIGSPIAKNIIQSSTLNFLGFSAHIILMLAAFMTLIALNMKVKDKKLISLLFILAFTSSFLGIYVAYALFFIVSFILLLYITHYFYQNYAEKKTAQSRNVLLAFAILTGAQLLFALSSVWNTFYVAAEIVQLISFITLLIHFIRLFRK
ncbi:hypothetical protein C4573_05800 [Candidatus Woesearchaeota archaeon]|nr:MAG: hypothetical protein C4573_05800 [Candidatus Woesearchaeota archaeon]